VDDVHHSSLMKRLPIVILCPRLNFATIAASGLLWVVRSVI
jgi:hypothetical protein